MMLTYREMNAEITKIKCDDDWRHGYSQYERSTNYSDRTEEVLSDGTHVWIAAWDDDCSGMVLDNIIAMGLNPNGFTYTGNEAEGLLGSGQWVEISVWDAGVGDVLLRDGHTEVVLELDGELYQGGFRISELGTIYGERGDQTGWEATYSEYNPYAWERCFRCVAERQGAAPSEPMPQQPASEPLSDHGFMYRAHVQNLGWCEPVRDGQVAGSVGYGARLEAIKITPVEGMMLDVMVHVENDGDVWYRGVRRGASSGEGSSQTDPIIGTVGESRRIEGIQVNVTGRGGDARGKVVYYRCHMQDAGWTGWTREGNYCGTRGEGRRVEAVQMMLVVEQDASDPINDGGIGYRVHTQDYGWLPEVRDGQVAGTTGQSRRVEAIQVTGLPEGLVLDFHAHVENRGDMAYDEISRSNPAVIGTVGQGLRLEAFNVHVLHNDTGKQLRYAGHVQDMGWTDACEPGTPCGTVGQSRRMEAIRLWLA